jgi:hypothetical protein
LAGALIEEPILDDLPEHSVQHLRGDLAGVGGGLAQLIVRLLVSALIHTQEEHIIELRAYIT